jgi:hypothetical protein
MRRSFCKGAAVSIVVYASAVALGFLIDFRLTLFAIPAIQMTWTLFCAIRGIQLRLAGAHKPEAQPYDREDYGFAAGGLVSAVALFVAIVVATQVV